MKEKTMLILMLAISAAVIAMAVVYAAFNSSLQITATVNTSGGIDVKTSCSCSTGIPGLTGASTVPTATCTPTALSNTTQATMTAKLYQPGDEITCTYTIQNDSAFSVKTEGPLTCGTLASPFTFEYDDSNIPTGTVIPVGGSKTFTLTMGYNSTITSQPSTTTGTVMCGMGIVQVG